MARNNKPVSELSVWVPPVPTPKPVPATKPAPVAPATATQVDPRLVRVAHIMRETGKLRHRSESFPYGDLWVEQTWAGPLWQEFALFMKVFNRDARYTVLHDTVSRRAYSNVEAFAYCRTCGTDCWAAQWTLDLLHAFKGLVTP